MALQRPAFCRALLLTSLAAVLACWKSMAFTAPPPPCSDSALTTSTYGYSRESRASHEKSMSADGPTILIPGATAMVVAALFARAHWRSHAKSKLARQQASSELPSIRAARPKGPQRLQFAERAQRFFSIRNRMFWDFTVHPRTYFTRQWMRKDIGYAAFIGAVHLGALAAPFYFTWQAFSCFAVGYLVTGLGITLSYHRQLAHQSFKTPKLLEYMFAYCGALALQSHPINWVSSHRHHHAGTETERDVHSPLDGFWWSHMGWLLDAEGTTIRKDKNNARDLMSQWFYRFLQQTYVLNAIVLPIIALYIFGGLPCVLWGFFFRIVWVWHITWAVNSVSHVWGFKDWDTKDNSMNNWAIGILAFGEGWHNNHHAFETSCRHGLKWWQVDFTWYLVKALNFLGLAWDLKYPSEGKMRKLTFSEA